MKILILGFSKIKYMPYMNFYLDNIDTKENEVHLLYWNRDLKEEDTTAVQGVTLHEFRCFQEDDVSKFSKIGSFAKYRKSARKLLLEGDFDFVIVLHSLPGVLVYRTLRKKYRGRYILDYRDSTYEGFAPFRRMIGGLVKSAKAVFVSSDAFRRFLPSAESGKIFTSHNLLLDALSHREERTEHGIPSSKIRFSFWGFIRHEEINREIIRKIAADSRFELHYYGREQQVARNLKAYAAQLGAENVFFHGEYQPEDRYEFVRSTDLIHNLYRDGNMMLAMGNKYYDAAIFRIPLVSMKGSFMAETAGRAQIGFSADPYEADFTDRLYAAYQGLDRKAFAENCDRELDRVLREYTSGAEYIRALTSIKEELPG